MIADSHACSSVPRVVVFCFPLSSFRRPRKVVNDLKRPGIAVISSCQTVTRFNLFGPLTKTRSLGSKPFPTLCVIR